MKTIDKNRVAHCFGKAAYSYPSGATAQQQIAGRLCSLMECYFPKHTNDLLEIGCGTGFLTRRLLKTFNPVHADINDLCPEMETHFRETPSHVHFIAGDAERLVFSRSYHIIASSSTLQWFADPEYFLQRMSACLRPGGMLAFSTFGPDNLKEIRTITGKGLSYRTLEEWKEITGRHYRVLHTEERHICLYFSDPVQVLRHLRETGVNGTKPFIRTKGALSEFCNKYHGLFPTETAQVTLTYHPVFLIASAIDH